MTIMIYLIDTIGNETGMNQYDGAFRDEFSKKNINVTILSNYKEDGTRQLLLNFYHGGPLKKILRLIVSWVRLFCFRMTHFKGVFVYQSFGLRIIDILFLLIFAGSSKLFVITHDIFEITDVSKGSLKRKLQKYVYRHWIKSVICHSEQAMETLQKGTSFCGNIICFPLFRYNFSKAYDETTLPDEIKNATAPGKINMLFFGQIRESKGIDVLIDAFKYIADEKQLNVIIAGSDKSGSLANVELPQNVVAICRYIRDDELNYLFANAQAVLLPYKEIYQSAVLETVVYFQKYAIMSDVRAFKDFSERYPSFGTIYSPNDGAALASCMKKVVENACSYNADDIQKYEEDRDIEKLISQMRKVSKSI